MCEPTTIAAVTMAVTSAGSAVTGYQGAKAQAEVQNAMYEQNKLNSYAAMRNEYMTSQQRQAQEVEAATQQIQDRRLEAIRQNATSNVAAGEAGVSGFSVERVLRDIGASASRDISTIEQNRDWSLSQISNQMQGSQTETKSRIQSMTKGIKPNPWSYAFKIAGGAANAGSTYMTLT